MKKTTAVTIVLLLAIGLAGCAGSAPSYYGVWSIDSLLPDAPLGDFNEEDMNTILDVSLTFSSEEATCFGDQMDSLGQTISKPEYIQTDVTREDFESMIGVSFDSLGISGSKIAQIAVVNDPTYNDGIVFYVVNDDTLLVNGLGTFFILKRAD